MRKKQDISLVGLGSYPALPHVEASSGRLVRFTKDCQMNCRAVYTQGAPHHVIQKGSLATILELSRVAPFIARLRMKYRKRDVIVAQYFLELMPKPLVVFGPLTEQNCIKEAHVEFALPCPVDGRSICTEGESHHVIDAGTKGRVLEWTAAGVKVGISGRRRPVCNVPFNFLDLLGREK